MKKLLFCFALLVGLLVAGCQDSLTPTATLLSGTDIDNQANEYIGRLGVQLGPTEVGLASHWWDRSDAHQVYGVYALQSLADPNGLGLLGRPYLGGQVTLDLDDDGGMYGFVVGTVYDLAGIEILTEFQVRTYTEALDALHPESEDRYKLFVGPRIRFK